ncbi:MAG: DEDD exonuclease domain-containing protein [Acidimicrobiales bacterium]|nr:DEDD exonuclease domain-containing protein [Acidimicrobiales bacterium]
MSEQMFDTGVADQRSLDDLGTALHDVTFVVIDLETTGGSAKNCAITEVGAVKLKGGECLGTYQTLVDPGCAIPPEITMITGITEAMVMRAPRIEAVMPSLLEFVGTGTVIVGHNIRFDIGFLNEALRQQGRDRLPHRSIDTLALARRLLRDEVPNCKLGTLADRLRLSHTPSHRALDDALATGDLLHLLLERAGSLGVTGLDDLLILPKLAGSAQAKKLPLTDGLPREPGVYLFRDARDEVLYVGKAANLRSRVRSYFSTDERRKIGNLLRETKKIDHHVCRNGLEAAVLEVRLIHRHLPRYNRQHTRSSKYPYVKLTLDERFPRLSVARAVKDDGAFYLGPISSAKRAKRIIEAIETAAPIRRCTARSTGTMSKPVCAAAQIGVAACPCSGATSEADYRRLIDDLVDTLSREPDRLLRPLEERIESLARDERFEEAADVRDRADALSGALRRGRRFDLLRRAGRVRVSIGAAWVEFDRGLLVACGATDDDALWHEGLPVEAPTLPAPGEPLGVPRRDEADELLTIVAWLEKNAAKVRVESLSGVLVEPLPRIPTFAPQGKSPASRSAERTGVGAERLARRTRIPIPRVL